MIKTKGYKRRFLLIISYVQNADFFPLHHSFKFDPLKYDTDIISPQSMKLKSIHNSTYEALVFAISRLPY
jgi:hypothetical protein